MQHFVMEADCQAIFREHRVTWNFTQQAADNGKVRCHIYDFETDKKFERPFITELGDDMSQAFHTAMRKVPTTPKPIAGPGAKIRANIDSAKDAKIRQLEEELAKLQRGSAVSVVAPKRGKEQAAA